MLNKALIVVVLICKGIVVKCNRHTWNKFFLNPLQSNRKYIYHDMPVYN